MVHDNVLLATRRDVSIIGASLAPYTLTTGLKPLSAPPERCRLSCSTLDTEPLSAMAQRSVLAFLSNGVMMDPLLELMSLLAFTQL